MTRNEIIAANPLPEYLRNRGFPLLPAGPNFVTHKCPVAEHRTFHRCVTIDTAKNLFHCNDCDKGGSIIDWIALEENLAASEAMRKLGGGRNGSAPEWKIVAAYDYTDASGNLLYQVCRMVPKDFRQRRPDGNGGWIWNMQGVTRVLYGLSEVLKAQTVCITEGEKDADNLRKLDFVATTNALGAGKWRDDYSETLRGKDVVIFGDDDEPGQKHVKQVVKSLTGKARSIKIVTLRGFHDISDFIAARPAASAKQAVDKLIEETLQVNNLVNSLGAEAIPSRLNSKLPKIQLPGDGRLLSAFAADCAKVLKNCGIYERGGIAFIVNQQRNGLDVITAPMLRTLAEQYLVCFRVARRSDGNVVSLPRTMSTDAAQGVLSAQQFLSRFAEGRQNCDGAAPGDAQKRCDRTAPERL